MDGRNLATGSPVEVGSLFPLFTTGFKNMANGAWEWGFLNHQQYLRSPPSAVKLSCFFCLSHSTKMPGEKKNRRFIQSRFRGSGLQRLVVGTILPQI